MTIRFATADDCKALLAIYAQYIDTPITFEYALPAQQEFERRITGVLKEYPWLACEENSRIVGYAHRHMEREAYQWSADLSVYCDAAFTGKGFGKKLYQSLIEIVKLQGIRTVYGGVTAPNVRSERLHASLGFKLLCTYHKTGYKCGKWHDVMWFEKQIAPYDASPEPIRKVSRIPAETLRKVLGAKPL